MCLHWSLLPGHRWCYLSHLEWLCAASKSWSLLLRRQLDLHSAGTLKLVQMLQRVFRKVALVRNLMADSIPVFWIPGEAIANLSSPGGIYPTGDNKSFHFEEHS